MTDDRDLQRLLHEAVSGVRAARGSDDVRRRAGRPSARRWVPISVGTAAAMVLLLGGTTWLTRASRVEGGGATGSPSGAGASAAPRSGGESVPTVGAARDLTVPVFYVGDTANGPRLFLEYHLVRDTTDTPVQAAVSEAVGAAPADPDYRNPLRDLGVRAFTTVSDGSPVVSFSRRPELPPGVDRREGPIVLQALVRTAQAAAETQRPVRFLVDSEIVGRILGVRADQPIGPSPDDDALSPVSIDSPAQGADVGSTFEVRGRAAAFEGNVVWQLKRGKEVVARGFTTADQCCTLSPYSFTVKAPPGEYTLVVRDTDPSGGEGGGTTQDTKDITVGQAQQQ